MASFGGVLVETRKSKESDDEYAAEVMEAVIVMGVVPGRAEVGTVPVNESVEVENESHWGRPEAL
jgi:hypothetical protein